MKPAPTAPQPEAEPAWPGAWIRHQQLRLAVLRVAIETAPKFTGGMEIENLLDRATKLFLWVEGSSIQGSVSEPVASEE